MYGNQFVGGASFGSIPATVGGLGHATAPECVPVAGMVADASTLAGNIEMMVHGIAQRLGLQPPPLMGASADSAPRPVPSVYEQLDDALITLRRIAGVVESIQSRVG